MKVVENDIFQEIQINNWEELKTFYGRLDSSWIFRGQANSKWIIRTKIERTKAKNKKFLESQIIKKLDSTIYNFGLSKIPTNEKEKLILLQHYGAPTRLIDFTISPYVATFFALVSEFKSSAIYAINSVKIWRLLDNFKSERYSKYISEEYRQNPSLLYCNFNDRKIFKDLILDNDGKESFIAPIHPEYHHDRTILNLVNFL